MSDGMIYDRGVIFTLKDNSGNGGGTIQNNDGTMECYQAVSYYINSNYKTFEESITHASNIGPTKLPVLKFMGTEI